MKILIGLLTFFFYVSPIAYSKSILILPDRQLTCLAKNVYYEARGEDIVGKLLVTQVVYNRVTNNDFCKVIYKSKQFSWTIKKQKSINKNDLLELRSLVIAFHNNFYELPDHLRQATHYHSIQVKPYWSKKLKYLGTWKSHRFYKDI